MMWIGAYEILYESHISCGFKGKLYKVARWPAKLSRVEKECPANRMDVEVTAMPRWMLGETRKDAVWSNRF